MLGRKRRTSATRTPIARTRSTPLLSDWGRGLQLRGVGRLGGWAASCGLLLGCYERRLARARSRSFSSSSCGRDCVAGVMTLVMVRFTEHPLGPECAISVALAGGAVSTAST